MKLITELINPSKLIKIYEYPALPAAKIISKA